MYPSPQEIPGEARFELFSLAWLTADPVRTFIKTAPTGIALLGPVYNEAGQLVDFHYQLINPILRSLTNHLAEDLFSHPLTTLNPGIVKSGMLARLIEVVNTGQPSQYVEEYQLDGVVGLYDQVYIKSGDGVLMLVQEVTYRALSADEKQQQMTLLEAILHKAATNDIRDQLLALISGKPPLASW